MPEAAPAVDKGSKVWFYQGPSSWALAEVSNKNDEESLSLNLPDNQIVANVSLKQVHPANPAVQDAIPDVTQLSHLNQPAILHNLLQRYQQDGMYTAAGPVLIALNPCRALPLYTAEVAGRYKAGCLSSSVALEPHIFGVAGAAFRDMLRLDTSQSIIINGESGAGKTETAKKAMQFLTAMAGGSGVDQQVLETNPILEAFGNAKTQRNPNSSRFGKLIEIHFTHSNQICGARIKTYLLEKNRVVHQLPGERSFHIFYQLLRGVTDPVLRQELRLPDDIAAFAYLAKTGCTDLPGVDDAANFSEVLQALTDIGLDCELNIKPLLSTLSGVLWLGNLRMRPGVTEDSSGVVADEALSNAAALLGVEEDQLAQAITHKQIVAGAEVITKTLKPSEAADARDALAKSLYAGVFNMIVTAINAKLDIGRMASGRFIAILDIYGFEHFESNSFEQLCINYANERLQQQFTHRLFTQEQGLYESEGINWTKINWVDNQASLDVIETNARTGPGLLSVLNTLCKIASSTDDKFLTELRNNLCDNDCLVFKPHKPKEFVIKHYAADVAYDVTGFLEKNRDTLNQDLINLLCSSTSSLVSDIGTATAAAAASTAESRGPSSRSIGQPRPSGQTVGSKFSSQLMDLIAMLDSTGLHFVRCIKPNPTLEPQVFDAGTVLQQLRCCGVLEVARVAQAGYPTRYRHHDFVERYRVLLPAEEEDVAAEAAVEGDAAVREAVEHLLGVFGVSQGEYELGTTMVFFKTGVLGQVEDRWAKMQSAAVKIQTTWHMCIKRKQYLALRSAAEVIQNSWRARAKTAAMNRRVQAAVVIQRSYRSYVARQKILHAIYLVREAHRAGQIDQGLSKRIESQVATAGAIDDLMLQYGILDMVEVKSALEFYSSLKNQSVAASGKGATRVQESLQLLAALRSAAVDETLTAEQLQQRLRVAALCEQHLGPEVSEEQLQDLIDAAAAAEEAQARAAAVAQQALLRQAALPSIRYSSAASIRSNALAIAERNSEVLDIATPFMIQQQNVPQQEQADQAGKKSRSLLSRAKNTVCRLTGQQATKPPVPPRVTSVARPNMASSTARQMTRPREPDALHNALAMALAAEQGVASPDALKETLAANAQLKKEVASLTQQLENEKAARMKFAKQQEQLALEWKSQVKVLESYIRSMQAELAAQPSNK